MRPFTTDIFWLPKAGNTTAEYEDAHFVGKWKKRFTQPRARLALAIADGATEGMLSRQWANLLVRRYVRHLPGPEHLEDWLSGTLRAWQYEKGHYLQQRERNNKPVQWYEEPGLEAGAFAALLGLVFDVRGAERDGTRRGLLSWQAVSIGDCFLVQERNGDCSCMFPFDESSALNNRPYLLSSNPARNRGIAERFMFAAGKASAGDRFYLMTDALAGWFLRECERGAAPWLVLDSFRGAGADPEFVEWIETLRVAREIRNDDVTLVRLEVPELAD